MVQILSLLTTLAIFAPTLVLATTFDVQVGKDGLTFTPNSIKAVNGDIINFVFASNGVSHTVVPSTSFLQPCGAATTSTFPTLNGPIGGGTVGYTVASSDTQWIHCGIANHCKQGMVFVINPPTTDSSKGGQTVANFQKLAEGQTISSGARGKTVVKGAVASVVAGVVVLALL